MLAAGSRRLAFSVLTGNIAKNGSLIVNATIGAKRNFHPALLIGTLLVKKIVAFSAMNAYGFPRIYRRLLEQNKVFIPAYAQKQTAAAIRLGFDYPTRIYSIVRDEEYVRLLLSSIAKSGSHITEDATRIPTALAEISKTIIDMVVRNNK